MLEIFQQSNGNYVVAEYLEDANIYRAPRRNEDYAFATKIDAFKAPVYTQRRLAQLWLDEATTMPPVIPKKIDKPKSTPVRSRLKIQKPEVRAEGKPMHVIRRLRTAKGISAQELSDLALMSVDWILKIEQGSMRMGDVPMCIGLRLADALGVDAHELLK